MYIYILMCQYCRGVMAMANAGINTNRSQFYFIFRSCPHLDNKVVDHCRSWVHHRDRVWRISSWLGMSILVMAISCPPPPPPPLPPHARMSSQHTVFGRMVSGEEVGSGSFSFKNKTRFFSLLFGLSLSLLFNPALLDRSVSRRIISLLSFVVGPEAYRASRDGQERSPSKR
jgi:cyclophilin family peptidyl-prolyl cis-trans isomerase